MIDALNIINRGLTSYLENPDNSLGDVPDDCGTKILSPPETINVWDIVKQGWWKPGLDLYQ